MVKSANPYADVPSLYDLYVQAAPRTGHLERFGLEVFRRLPRAQGSRWTFLLARSTSWGRGTD